MMYLPLDLGFETQLFKYSLGSLDELIRDVTSNNLFIANQNYNMKSEWLEKNEINNRKKTN